MHRSSTDTVMLPVQVEVITPLPESWGTCVTCEAIMAQAGLDQGPYTRGLEEYPPEWQEEFNRFSDLIIDLSTRYADTILIRIFDPRSLQGLWKSIRYGVRRYPTFIVTGGQKISGWDIAQLEQVLKQSGAVEQ
ncbi:MAG: hypothetical protein AB1894_15580 [Chloroflexota bacterium]